MAIPLIVRAIVLSQDPDNGAVFVVLLGTGSIIGDPSPSDTTSSISVRCMFQGPTDPFRMNLDPLPMPGQYGLVCFPLGDIRSGIWIGSFFPTSADSLPGERGDENAGFLKYFSSFSGYWDYLDADGKYANQFPDSSTLVIGPDADLPTVYRNIVDDSQLRVQEEFTMEDRVAEPPDDPFELQYTHGAGTQVTVDTAGNLYVFGATTESVLGNALDAPATLDIEFGGTILAIGPADSGLIDSPFPAVDADTPGDMNMIGNLDPVASWKAEFAGATIEIDHSGNINITSPGTITANGETITMISSGETSITSATTTMTSSGVTSISGSSIIIDSSDLASVVIDAHIFTLHTHTLVQSGTEISGPVGT